VKGRKGEGEKGRRGEGEKGRKGEGEKGRIIPVNYSRFQVGRT
jgi:hypothetical protein